MNIGNTHAEFNRRLFAGEDDVEVRRNEGHTWVEHLALSIFYFANIQPVKGVMHGSYACGGFGSGVQGLTRALGPATVTMDRRLLVREMQVFLDREGKRLTVKLDTDFEIFDSMSAAFMASALPPLKGLNSGDLELTASLFSQFASAIQKGMGFVWVSNPKVKGGIDLDIVSPSLWRRMVLRDGNGRDLSKDDIWTAAVHHMRERVANAGILTEQYTDKLFVSLAGLAKSAPAHFKHEFSDLSIKLAVDWAERRASGPWSSAER